MSRDTPLPLTRRRNPSFFIQKMRGEKTMNEIVKVKNNDIFTDSLIISSGTGIEHRKLKNTIRKYEDRLKKFGILSAPHQAESTGGRPEEFYILNEQQATFLMTLLKNTDIVVDFKMKLVKEFYRMREFIREKQSAEWQQARITGKLIRQDETDIILTKLIPLAESQGSKHPEKLYLNYSKLVNSILGIGSRQRDNLPLVYIETIKFLERAIENIISIEVDKSTYYKEIYQICKAKCQMIKELSFLPTMKLIA